MRAVAGIPLAADSARVLIVEDDEGIRDTLKYHLAAAGFTILAASDGPSGLRAARTGKPDLILLDLMLPGMGAWRCAGPCARRAGCRS